MRVESALVLRQGEGHEGHIVVVESPVHPPDLCDAGQRATEPIMERGGRGKGEEKRRERDGMGGRLSVKGFHSFPCVICPVTIELSL